MQPLQLLVPCSSCSQETSRSSSSALAVAQAKPPKRVAHRRRARAAAGASGSALTGLEKQQGISVPPSSGCPHPAARNLASGRGRGPQVGAASCRASAPGAPLRAAPRPPHLLHAGHEPPWPPLPSGPPCLPNRHPGTGFAGLLSIPAPSLRARRAAPMFTHPAWPWGAQAGSGQQRLTSGCSVFTPPGPRAAPRPLPASRQSWAPELSSQLPARCPQAAGALVEAGRPVSGGSMPARASAGETS